MIAHSAVAVTLSQAVSKVSRALVGLLVHSRARLLEKGSMAKQALYRPTEDRNAHRLLRRPVFIPLGKSLIHERPGGCAPSEATQWAKLPTLSLILFKKERGMASVKKEGTRERKWARESGKTFCVGLVQYGSLDLGAVLSFPMGNEMNKPPSLPNQEYC